MAKILLIEDNEYLGRMYQNLFSLENHQVEWCLDGEMGIIKAEEFQPDLILLDIIMPKINGLQVLRALKANPKTKDLKVIVLTVIGEKEIIEECMKMGADGYIIKSTVNLDQLLSEVKTHLEKSS